MTHTSHGRSWVRCQLQFKKQN